MPTKVVQFIAGVRIAVLLLSALNLSKSSSSCTNVNVGYSQSNSYLWLINIKNGSSLINCLNFVYMMLIIAGLHLVIFILVVLLRKVSDTKWIKKTILKLFNWMTFGLYIRIIMQQYLFLLIISLSELYLFRFNSEDHFTSKIFSAVLLSICHAIVLVWFWVVFVPTTEQKEQTEQTDQSQTKRRLWAHWTNGLQDKLWKRIFAILFFIRRIVFWVLILLFKDLSMYLKVWSYSAIQLSYIAILCLSASISAYKRHVV